MILNEQRYSLGAVAKLLEVHIATIWRWVLSGVRSTKLKSIKIGGRRFVLHRDLTAFLTAINENKPADESDFIDRACAAGKALDATGVKSGRRCHDT